MTVELRTWRYEPCPSVTGVKHDGCDYLGHIICDKCGWVEPDHRCGVHYGTLTPDGRLQTIVDASRCEHGKIDSHEVVVPIHDGGYAFIDCQGAPELRSLVDALTEGSDG